MTESIIESVNHKAVCRSAPATPGLLIKCHEMFQSFYSFTYVLDTIQPETVYYWNNLTFVLDIIQTKTVYYWYNFYLFSLNYTDKTSLNV